MITVVCIRSLRHRTAGERAGPARLFAATAKCLVLRLDLFVSWVYDFVQMALQSVKEAERFKGAVPAGRPTFVPADTALPFRSAGFCPPVSGRRFGSPPG